MNTYHPQIKKELGFPAACRGKGRGKRNNSKKTPNKPSDKGTSGQPHPKMHLGTSDYEKMYSAAARVLLNTYV